MTAMVGCMGKKISKKAAARRGMEAGHATRSGVETSPAAGKKMQGAIARKGNGNPNAASGIKSALGAAYGRVPVFPYLDRATTLLLIACMLCYAGFTLYVFMSSPPGIEARLVEGSLVKNSALALSDGDRFLYSLDSPDGSEEVAYAVGKSPQCAGVVVAEQTAQSSQSICVLQNGMLSDAEPDSGSNFGNRSILLFSPWMLAASDNFSWNVSTVYSSGGIEMAISTAFASRGKKQMAGREAYEIDVGSEGGSVPARFYIDSAKRVLLYADMGNVTARLVSAPFALNWTN